ncbi:methylmalonyl Co-A mutase-associated GTPase MeaB [Lunatimonas salinarum]|uniref:methylmalonyl Co-A mutase-associated GTPase MeaB n=1 Tax=Lunatimonas salinarum TaxID=1774590 RepID=UPI001ADF86AE|nr:methylmalonyl Co-A mutase-associated GTPase MeaB [Lunatimonas salinarum]
MSNPQEHPLRHRMDLDTYAQGVLEGDRVVLSRAITLVESSLASDQLLAGQLMERLMPYTGKSLRVGITGPPGVGKSTFIDRLGGLMISQGHRVAVLAVDPSSLENKGSILGDKTRMQALCQQPNAYIRPSPSKGTLGGISAHTRESSLLCEAAGFDRIIVETVGVGQSEVSVREMVDFFVLLTMPGAGDELQGIKKGVMEMADLIMINKADGDRIAAALLAHAELENALLLFPAKSNGWIPKILTCSSTDSVGLDQVLSVLEEFAVHMSAGGFMEAHRAEQRVHWLHQQLRYLLERRFFEHPEISEQIPHVREQVRVGQISSIAAANRLMELFLK